MKIDLLAQELSLLNWSAARTILAAHFIANVIKLGTVNLAKLAKAFDTDAQADSNYKRIQRFFRYFVVDFEAIAKLLVRPLQSEPWMLCMDRTNWQVGKTDVNILVLAIAYKGIAIPVLWTFLDKKGNSNTDERIALMERFLKLFGKRQIHFLTADREFRGKAWLKYLVRKGIAFRLRIPNNTLVWSRGQNKEQHVKDLFRIRGDEVKILRQSRKVWGVPVFIGATCTCDEHLIVISNVYTLSLVDDYRNRWDIETLFGCLKSRGLGMEDTRLRDTERLSKLLALLAIAFCWCYRVGEWRNEQKTIRRLNHNRQIFSVFRYGLDYLQRLFFRSSTRVIEPFAKALGFLFYGQPSTRIPVLEFGKKEKSMCFYMCT